MIVLVPSFEPDERLPHLVAELAGMDGIRLVVVDDGSGADFAEVFAAVRLCGAEVLTHPGNRGKGAALRTGFAHILGHHPGEAVVCADSDGQHTLLDILRVAAAVDGGADMVLGARRFTGNVPLRSRFGNATTRAAFALISGRRLLDTQTGLRGYPHRMLPWLLGVPGDRFEYELELLLRGTRERLTIQEVDIATIYLADNASSHFRPVRDSLRIYLPLLAYAGSSLAGFALDAALVFALYAVFGRLALAVVIARLASASLNFWLNRRLVFAAGRSPLWPAAARCALLALSILTANLALMELLTPVAGLVAAKVITEVSLFSSGYLVQRRFVFTRPGPAPLPSARVVVPAVAASRGRR